jgi:hypothetical protein
MRDTIEMAREAGFPFNKYGLLQGDGDGEIDADKMFKAFEALVRADEREQGQKWFDAVTAQHRVMILAEREACAKVADYYATGMERNYSEIIADAIRARGETK